MPHDLLRWPFRTPTRLLTTLTAVLAVLVAALWTLSSGPDPSPTPTSAQTSPPAEEATRPAETRSPASASTPQPSPASTQPATEKLTDREQARARTVIQEFLRAWLPGPDEAASRRVWVRRVRPHVTPELLAGMRLTDPAALPRGRPARIEVTAAGAFVAETTVQLDTGATLAVRLVDDGDQWLVSDIQPEQSR